MMTLLSVLVGVGVGFFLTSFWEKKRDEALLTKKRRAIESELRTNVVLIPQKRDLLLKIQSKLRKGKLLRSSSVHFPVYCYLNYIGEISVWLTDRQRENLVVIYDTLRIIDEYMDRFFSEYIEMHKSKAIPSFREGYIGEIADLINQCSLAETLIKEYLAGKPRKIAWDELPQWQ